MRVARVAIPILLMIAASAPSVRAADALEVSTSAGVVRGIRTPQTREWRGIPYAAPPLAELRWRPPAAPEPWAGVRDAGEFAERCLQPIGEFETIGSEDCLYLNVFAPRRPAADAQLPVMVHLHAGANVAYRPHRDASALVAHDVMVVTVAYRLGVFGFAGHPALTEEEGSRGASAGEYGLLDQIAALRWVQANIAAFGGDPANVTLFGAGSGSLDAVALVASPLTAGLFQRAALQTQTYWALHGAGSTAAAEALGLEAAHVVGCSTVTDPASCLRSAPADDLVLALGFREFLPPVGGQMLPAAPLDLIAGQEAPVPLLVGSNRDEAAHWFEETFNGEAYSRASWRAATDALAGPAAGEAIRALYDPQVLGSRLSSAVAAFSDAIHTCPARRLANASGGTVYRYLYAHALENHELAARVGAGHFTDEAILWHDARLLHALGVAGYRFSESEERLSAQMAAYWTRFAKTGDPNGKRLPEWPLHDPDEEAVLVLDESVAPTGRWRTEACDLFDTLSLTLEPSEFMRRHVPSTVLDHWLEGSETEALAD